MSRETLQEEMEQVVAYLGQLKELWEQQIAGPLPEALKASAAPADDDFIVQVEQMRQAQKSYFKTKNTKVLQRSKMLEEQVDKLIGEYKNPKLL